MAQTEYLCPYCQRPLGMNDEIYTRHGEIVGCTHEPLFEQNALEWHREKEEEEHERFAVNYYGRDYD